MFKNKLIRNSLLVNKKGLLTPTLPENFIKLQSKPIISPQDSE